MSDKTELAEQASETVVTPEDLHESNGVYSNGEQTAEQTVDASPQAADGCNTETEGSQTEAEPVDPLVAELRQSRVEVEKLQSEVTSLQDKYLRALADLENVKKRAQKERSELIRYQGESIIIDLLRVVDELDLAVNFYSNQQAAESAGEGQSAQDSQKLIEGLQLIYKNFLDVLKRWDIRPESALGQQFDPQKHMAISKVVVADSQPGTVISELKKLYMYKDKVVRIAEVVVAAEN